MDALRCVFGQLSSGRRRRSQFIRRNFLATLAFFVLIVIRGGDVVRSAALYKFPAAVDQDPLVHNSVLYNSVSGFDKPSVESEMDAGLVSDTIFWGATVDAAYPKGFTAQNYSAWTDYVHGNGTRIAHLEQDKCGRMQNRMVEFSDGTLACGRYRQNTDQIQGELFSFYLGRLLNLSNMAPTALQIVAEDQLWADAAPALSEAGWKAQRPVVLTKHVEGLVPAGIPSTLKNLKRHLNKFDVTLGLDGMKNSLFDREDAAATSSSRSDVDGNLLADRSSSRSKLWPSINWFNVNVKSAEGAHPLPLGNLIELAQWSDLVIFDYLIAHLDRVVNNLYNYQWNSEIMDAPAHNLAKDPHTNLLVFLDNESGLLHGYRLLNKYQGYHSLLLENVCLFRRSTVDQLRWLERQDVGKLLNGMFLETTPKHLSGYLPLLPEKSIVVLRQRISEVLRHVDKCRAMFSK